MDIGVPELAMVLVVVLLLFGGSKLPDLARSLGKAQSEFKKAASPEPTTPSGPDSVDAAPAGPSMSSGTDATERDAA